MANIVIAFESRYGQSQKIAEHIADRARRHGHSTRMLRASRATHATLDDADAFVVVAPVYFGQHPHELRRFLRIYGGVLGARPLAFVSVCNSAAQSSAEAKANAVHMAYRTVDEAALTPLVVTTVAGALAYPRYGFLLRQVMRLIAKRTGTPQNTKRIHELTDWDGLDLNLEPFFTARALERGETSGIRPLPKEDATAPVAAR